MNFVEKGQPMTTPQGQAPEAIAGALFDFTGFLTTLPKERAVTLSGAHLATPVVDLLTEWAKTRGLNLDEANVKGWVAALTAVPADTNTTSGAADLPEALINIAREIEALKRDCGMDPESAIAIQNGRYMAISSEIRALAAGQATAAQAVVPAEWPTNEMIDAGRKAAASQGRLLGSGQSLWHVFRAMLAAAPAQPAAQQGVAYADAHGTIMSAAYDFRDAHISGSPNQKRSAHAALESAVTHALRASNGQAPAAPKGDIDD